MYRKKKILKTDLKWKERKEKKKIKIEAIKKWFSFFWIIIIPISNYIVILIILYLIYYNIYIIIKTLKNYINNKYIIYIKNKKIYPIIIFIKNIISFFIFCIKFIFIDLKTGKNILMSIYINLHIFLGNFQLNIFYLKNAYKKGVYEKNKKLGIYYMYIWLKLKCIVEVENLIIWILKKIKKFLWKQKKKIKKKYLNTILINLNIKLSILWLLIQNHKNLQELKIIIIIFIKNIIYIIINKYIINYFEKNMLDIYIYVYLNIIKQIKKYIKKK